MKSEKNDIASAIRTAFVSEGPELNPDATFNVAESLWEVARAAQRVADVIGTSIPPGEDGGPSMGVDNLTCAVDRAGAALWGIAAAIETGLDRLASTLGGVHQFSLSSGGWWRKAESGQADSGS